MVSLYNLDIFFYYSYLLTEEGENPRIVKNSNDFYNINNPLLYDGDLGDEAGESDMPDNPRGIMRC